MTILRDSQRPEAPADAPTSAEAIALGITGAQLPMVLADARRGDEAIVFANPAFLALTGYRNEEVLGRNCRFLQGPETSPAAVDQIRAALAASQAVTVEILNYRKDGSSFWNALHISPVRDAAGELVYFFGSQRDVTARRQAELELARRTEALRQAMDESTRRVERALAQKTSLLHEVDHRVKNNLQLISSLLLLQSRRTESEATRAALRRVLERVTAVATVHRRLFQGETIDRFDFAEFVADLVHDLTGAAPRPNVQVVLDLEPVDVGASQAAPLALILSELLTNALRHAHPASRGGAVRVGLAPLGGGFELRVEDDGVGAPDLQRPAHGFGLTIAHLLAQQLRADIKLEDARPGLRATVRCPVSLAV